MKILVCIKQVPDSQKVQVDPITGSLMRAGIDAKMNPYDLFALEAALQLKDSQGAHVTVMTMGPQAAVDILREAYALGSDDAVLVSDRGFAGADVLATAHTLAYAIQALNTDFDLILCGKQTTDGDTAQVGPAVAEILGIPHVSWVDAIRSSNDDSVTVHYALTSCTHLAQVKTPCLLTIEKDYSQPRYPSYLKIKAASKRQPRIVSLKDLNGEDVPAHVGSMGSATQVERIFPPASRSENLRLEGDSTKLANDLFEYLINEHIIAKEIQ